MDGRPRCLFPTGPRFSRSSSSIATVLSAKPAMLVCNLTTWIRALEHALLATETHSCARLSLLLAPLPFQLDARLWGL